MSDILLVTETLDRKKLKDIAQKIFGDLVKGVVDIEKEVIAIGAELHADEEAFLLDLSSEQKNLWGINLYPDMEMPDMLEFDSMINIRPSSGNASRNIEDTAIREKISEIVKALIK